MEPVSRSVQFDRTLLNFRIRSLFEIPMTNKTYKNKIQHKRLMNPIGRYPFWMALCMPKAPMCVTGMYLGIYSCFFFISFDWQFPTWNRANERMNHHNFSTLLCESIDLPLPELKVLNDNINIDATWIAHFNIFMFISLFSHCFSLLSSTFFPCRSCS